MSNATAQYQRDQRTLSWQLRRNLLVEWSSNFALLGVATAACWGIFDLGGVLPWTQWGIAVVVTVSLLASLPATLLDPVSMRTIAFALPVILLFGCLWGFLQQVPVPISALKLLSPGAAEAYTSLSDLGVDPPGLVPFSLSPDKTRHWISIGIVIATSTWIVATSVRSAIQVKVLLWVFVSAGAVLAAIGLYQLTIDPTLTFFGYKAPRGGYPFGTYINRNNAALILNLSVASALALATEAILRHSSGFRFSILANRVHTAAMTICLTLIGSGLLLNGSRGGIASCIIGLILAAAYVPQYMRRNLLPPIAVLATVILAVAAFIETPQTDTGSQESYQNDQRFTVDAILNDARFAHWPDGFQASKSYFPAGAGLGAYRYAYLPFINSTPDAWYHHADNLWLEWLTELGFAALVISVTFIFIQAFAFAKLRASARPMDFGLGLASAFGCAAILCSQFFDFGILWPGAGIMASSLFAMTIGRASLADIPIRSKVQPFLKPVSKEAIWLTTLIMVLLSTIAINQLMKSAEADYVVRHAKKTHPNQDNINVLERLLSDARRESPLNPELKMQFASNEISAARLEVLATWVETEMQTSEELTTLYSLTSPQSLRKRALRSTNKADDPSETAFAIPLSANVHFERSREAIKEALKIEPLNPTALHDLVTLDFEPQSAKTTHKQLFKLYTLYKNSSKALYKIGQLATDSGHHSIAKSAWSDCTNQNPDFVVPILRKVAKDSLLNENDVIGSHPDSLLAAANFTLQTKSPDEKLLKRSIPAIESQSILARSFKDRIAMSETLIRAYLALGDENAAEKIAFHTNVGDQQLTLTLAQIYQSRGDSRKAIRVLKTKMLNAPRNQALQRLLDQLEQKTQHSRQND